MLRSLFTLLTVGVVGIAAASVMFTLLLPIVLIAIKIGLFVVIGYFLLRMIKPEMADNLRDKVKGERTG